MKKTTKVILFVLAASLLQACAHTAEKRVDAQLAQEKTVPAEKDLHQQWEQQLGTSKLSADQKEKMRTLHKETVTKMKALHDESLRLRSLLIKDMMADKFDRGEVQVVEKKLKTNENKRLALTFDSIDKANLIMGRDTDMEFREKMMDEMFTPNDLNRPDEHGIY